MKFIHNIKNLYSRRKELRTTSTPEEILLWLQLKNSKTGFKFRRQHSIGGYITDFYCPAKKLVVEIDGPQHLKNKEYDETRTRYFEGLNIKVLRFTNKEIGTETQNVVKRIKDVLTTSPD
jgi:very-short-patch-repair endonuclease